jgi:hypothetical protein
MIHRSLGRAALALSLVAVALCATAPPASAQAGPRGAPPALPHEVQRDRWPQPDYFAEALKLTSVKPGDAAKSVRLKTADGRTPRTLVLPVQTQAFGFAPAFRAIIAANLDHELAARHVDANRQTDVLDVNGPWVRRLDDATVNEFAAAYPSSSVLGLYIGHDGAGQVFITLELKEAGQTRRAHRSLPMIQPFQTTMVAALPAMLDELKFASAPGTAPPTGSDCSADAWRLEQPVGPGAAALACRAIVVGTLMPSLAFPGEGGVVTPDSPPRLAWLASAMVESQALAKSSPAQAAISLMAWGQLMPAGIFRDTFTSMTMPDPVVAPLAKLITAPSRGTTMPVRSTRNAVEELVDAAAEGLPPFARAVFMQRGIYGTPFHRVDLCEIEGALPGSMPSARCPRETGAVAGRASPVQLALYQQWRLAAAYSDIHLYGHTYGQRDKRDALVAALPADLARHPLIRQMRFQTDKLEAQEGSLDSILRRMQTAFGDFVQSTAELQRYDGALTMLSLSAHLPPRNTNIANDPVITRLTDDEARLLMVLRFDRETVEERHETRVNGDPALFLTGEPAREALHRQEARKASASTPSVPASTATPAPVALPRGTRPLFQWDDASLTTSPLEDMTEEALRAVIVRQPAVLQTRTALAMRMLQAGRPLVEARKLIDDVQANSRDDDRVAQSHAWADPAHAFFFASDMESARVYYQKVVGIGTGSGSEAAAQARLAMIDRSLPRALEATQYRKRRYDSDFVRRDLSGLLFMTGHAQEAWAAIVPRLALASTFELWTGAVVGTRAEKRDLAAAKAWIGSQRLEGAQFNYQDAALRFLHTHAVIDRLPSDADIAVLKGQDATTVFDSQAWVLSARLQQMLLRGEASKEELDAWRSAAGRATEWDKRFLQPGFTWLAWQALSGRDPELDIVRATSLQSIDFHALLAKSMLQAREGQTAASLQFLQAARYRLSELASGQVDTAVPQPYQYAQAAWLMFRQTGQEVYRTEALRFARAHQQMFPFWAWSYALEGLLERDTKRQAIALCRARFLDANSYFLSLAKPLPGAPRAACPKALW